MPYSDGEPQFMQVNYYAALFDSWAQRDLQTMLRRDRNHPSVFMWSIGNEIAQMRQAGGAAVAERLVEWTRALDSRPVTCAVVASDISETTTHNIGRLDVCGFNYPSGDLLDEFHRRRPLLPIVVTEHYSAQTRRPLGMYFARGAKQPAQEYSHNDAWRFVLEHEEMRPGARAWFDAKERPFVCGEFIWTGFDYLGEPTPYDFPAHTSFFGVIDLCGNPKDGYYFYRSEWRDEPLIHIASHWDYKDGEIVDLAVISNCETVELAVNGSIVGRANGERNIFHFELPFHSGLLEARGLKDGKITAGTAVRTSGTPHALEITRFFGGNMAPGEIEYLSCVLRDASGAPVRNSVARLSFEVSGAGRLLAVANGSQIDPEPFQGSSRVSLCDGRCLAIVKALKLGKLCVSAAVDSSPISCGMELTVG